MNTKLHIFMTCILTWILLVTGGTTVYADSDHSRSGNFEKRIAGTYLVREAPDEAEIFLRLITLTADGNWFSIDAHQQSFGFSDQQGVWKKSGRREITANVIDFDLLPDGTPKGVVRIRFVMSFSKNLRRVTGTFFGEAFTLDQDPLDPNAMPIDTFENTFQGKRVIVHKERDS